MSDKFVIVRLDNGAHAPVSKTYADLVGLKPLKKSAYDKAGRLRPIKYPATSPAAATESSGDSAASDKK